MADIVVAVDYHDYNRAVGKTEVAVKSQSHYQMVAMEVVACSFEAELLDFALISRIIFRLIFIARFNEKTLPYACLGNSLTVLLNNR